MNERAPERVESAIVHLIAQFPGLLGPKAIRAALKTVFGLPDAQAARAGQDLMLLEALGLISHEDLGEGCFVYRLTARGAHLLGDHRVRIQLRQKPRPRRIPVTAHASPLAASGV
jgi:hypothetical protein